MFTNLKTTDRVVLVATITKVNESRPCGITITNSTQIVLAWETILNCKIMGTVMRAPPCLAAPNGDGVLTVMVESQQETFRVLQ